MPQDIKKAPAKSSDPVVEKQEEAAPDTVELKGENIEVVRDYVDFSALNKSKLRLVAKDGRDVKDAFPDHDFAWFDDGDAYDMENIVGWQKVHIVFGDSVRASAQPNHARRDAGQIELGKNENHLVAYCIPRTRRQEYLDWVQREQVLDVEGMRAQSTSRYTESSGDSPVATEVSTEIKEL